MSVTANARPALARLGLAHDGLRFALAGLLNTGFTIALYQALLSLTGPGPAYAVAWAAGLAFVFVVYPSRVFPNGRQDVAARVLITLVYVTSFCLGLAVVHLASRAFGAERLAILASLAVTTCFNFAAMRVVLRPKISLRRGS